MCLIKVNQPSLNFQDQVAVTHYTDQELISCHEKFWTKQQTQTLLIDSSEAQEAAKFGKYIIHPTLFKAKERARK